MLPCLLLLSALAADPVRAEPAEPAVDIAALAIDVDDERLACHGPLGEPEISHAQACTSAQRASEQGDIIRLVWMVEIMQRHDPSSAEACTSRFDGKIAQNPPRRREDYRAGLAAMKAGELQRARACFRLSLARDPYNQVAARRLGEVEAAMERRAAESEEPPAAPEAPAPSSG
jgi:TolA-binding protein